MLDYAFIVTQARVQPTGEDRTVKQWIATRKWQYLSGAATAALVLYSAAVADAQTVSRETVGGSTAPRLLTVADPQSEVSQAAWANLELLRQYVETARLRDLALRNVELPKVQKALAQATHVPMPPGEPQPPIETMEGLTSLWPAAVAHYVGGFKRENLKVALLGEQEAIATILSVNPQDQKVADEVTAEVRNKVAAEGLTGQSLHDRERILYRRELATRGIGLPLEAIVQVRMMLVDGQWKIRSAGLATKADLMTGHATTLPARPVVLPGPATSTAPAQP